MNLLRKTLVFVWLLKWNWSLLSHITTCSSRCFKFEEDRSANHRHLESWSCLVEVAVTCRKDFRFNVFLENIYKKLRVKGIQGLVNVGGAKEETTHANSVVTGGVALLFRRGDCLGWEGIGMSVSSLVFMPYDRWYLLTSLLELPSLWIWH